ncbi:hypothetical protein L1987_56254 [Smallanthus sonchifolius]|uniref:Uncharacterized protein n=1 Tax=Smallanthus sonchifolius TaxID=185202 RepID=A0ACB9EBW5_9ASTR|nr:hypothetical protein L1987_56254 [Smallanthus sonchifolius]
MFALVSGGKVVTVLSFFMYKIFGGLDWNGFLLNLLYLNSAQTNMEGTVIALTENVVMPVHEVLNAFRIVKKEAVQNIDPIIITQASLLSSLPMDASSADLIISMGRSQGFPGDKLFKEFSRVLKPGGELFLHQTIVAAEDNTTSSLERKLLVGGFSDIEVVRMAEVLSEGVQSFGVKGKKPSWKIGSSFLLRSL